MFKPEDFQLSLEKKLKLRVVVDDIENCHDVETLQNSLKAVTEQLMRYQQLLDVTLKNQITADLKDWISEIEGTKTDKM
jgi:hypothetical protein